MTRLLAILLALLAWPAAASAFAPVSVPVPTTNDGVAYAGGHILWVTHEEKGPLVVHRAPATGGPATVLATIERVRPSSQELEVELSANANGWILAARDGRLMPTGECGCDYSVSEGELVVRGTFDGPAADVVRCAPPKSTSEQTRLRAVAGTAGFAFAGAQCGAAAQVNLVAADGTVRPLATLELPSPASVATYGIDLAEPFLGITSGTTKGSQYITQLELVDTRNETSRILPRENFVSDFDFEVLEDGTVLSGTSGYFGAPHAIYNRPQGATAATRIPGIELPDLGGWTTAGRQVFFAPRKGEVAGQRALGLIARDGSGLRAVGAPGAGAPRQPLASDGATAAFVSRSCSGAGQITVVDLTEAAAPAQPLGCPVIVKAGKVTFDRKGRAKIGVTCPNGCRDRLQLYIDLTEKRVSRRDMNRYVDRQFDSRLANAVLRLPADGAVHQVTVKLAKPARALLRKYRRIRVFPQAGSLGNSSTGSEVPASAPKLSARLAR